MYSICIASIWHHHMWGMLHLNAFDAKEPGHANDVSIKQGSSVAILRWTRYERDRLSASFSREFAPRNFTLMAWSQMRRDRRSLPKVFVAGFFCSTKFMVGSFVCSVKDFLLISAHDSPFGVVKARGRSSRIASCIWIHFRNPQLK